MAGTGDMPVDVAKAAARAAIAAGKRAAEENLSLAEAAAVAMEGLRLTPPSEHGSNVLPLGFAEDEISTAASVLSKLLLAASLGTQTSSPSTTTPGSSSTASLATTASMMEPLLAKAKDPLFESLVSNIKLVGALLESLLARTATQDLPAEEMMQQIQQEVLTGTHTPQPTLPGPDNMEMDATPPHNNPEPIHAPLHFLNPMTFMRTFHHRFLQYLDCPRIFSTRFMDQLLPAVVIVGASLRQFLVRVEVVDQRARLTEGWADFVAAERLVRGDVGYFILEEPNTMLLTVFGPTGQIKLMSERPLVWNDAVANGYDQVEDQRYHLVHRGAQRALNFHAPNHIMAMQYVLGPRLDLSVDLMMTITNAWMSFATNFPIYAVRFTNSQANGRSFYFSTAFSQMLPLEPTPVSIFYANAENSTPATMTRRMPDQLVRITHGWRSFVREYSLRTGDVFVFTFNNQGGHLMIRMLCAMLV